MSQAWQQCSMRSVSLESFDEEAGRAREEIFEHDTLMPARILMQLEPHFLRFGFDNYDEELSLEVIQAIIGALSDAEVAEFPSLIENFFEKNEAKLSQIFDDYREDLRATPLIFLPAVFLVWERLERDPYRLQQEWEARLPSEYLQELATVWGRPIGA